MNKTLFFKKFSSRGWMLLSVVISITFSIKNANATDYNRTEKSSPVNDISEWFSQKNKKQDEQNKSRLTNGDKPNVLFVAIDDLNDWVGCMGGNPQVETPNLDKFNSEGGGMVMYKAHAPATVCCPSRSALLTGVNAHKTGVYGNQNNLKYAPKAKDLVTLPEYFSSNGYTSLTMGKIFHKHNYDDREDDHGQWAFDEYNKTLGGVGPISSERPVNGLPTLEDENLNAYHAKAFDWGPTKGNDETQMLDYKTAKWAADQFQNRDFEKPFFMAVGISKPHLSWYVPQKYFDMYPLEEIVLPQTIPNDLDDILDKYGNRAFHPHDTWRRVEKYDRHKEAVQAYLATITFVDDCIGVLLDGLNNSKYAENTIVMLWGDHGWHLGEKQKYGKTQLWQEASRVPMMVKVPGVTPNNKKCYGLVNLIDMYPTLLELSGLPKNPKNDGRSFAALIHNPDMAWNFPTLTTMGFGNHRIFDGRYSYINHKSNGAEQLYDHQTDSMEWTNLINDREYEDIKLRLKALLPENNEPESPKNNNLPAPKDTTRKVWFFPGDTLLAWQFDYSQSLSGDVFFARDSSQTIGIYGCNDTSGYNIRSYVDAEEFKDAAQFKWDNTAETFQKNGQWISYSAKFTEDAPYQLAVRARNNIDANFKVTVSGEQGDSLFYRNANILSDFTNLGGGNNQTDWYLSKFPLPDLCAANSVHFDWYDNIGEPGIFGGFSFVKSNMDITPPEWYFVSIGNITRGTDITVMTTEDAQVYLVPAGTLRDSSLIKQAAVANISISAYADGKISTSQIAEGDYVVYAIDNSNNISEASRLITVQIPVNNALYSNNSEICIAYSAVSQNIQITSNAELEQIDIYSILGKKVKYEKCYGKMFLIAAEILPKGIYIVHIQSSNGNVTRKKISI